MPPSRLIPAIVTIITPKIVKTRPVMNIAAESPTGNERFIIIGVTEPTMVEIPMDMPYTIDIPILSIAFENPIADNLHSAPQSIGTIWWANPFSDIIVQSFGADSQAQPTEVTMHKILYIPQKAAHENGSYFLYPKPKLPWHTPAISSIANPIIIFSQFSFPAPFHSV